MAEFFIQKVRQGENEVIIRVKTMKNEFSTLEVVRKIEDKDKFWTLNKENGQRVGIYKKKFIRSYKDGKWTNNLDELDKF